MGVAGDSQMRGGGACRGYSAALTIVADQMASPEARVFAMRMLAWLFYPNADLNFGDFVDLDGDGDRSCFGGGPPMHFSLVRGELLPLGWPEAIKQAARRVHSDASEPERVRRAALCFELMRPDGILRREGVQDVQR